MNSKLMILGLMTAGSVFNTLPASASTSGLPDADEVCLFAHPNYEGLIGCFKPGIYSDLHDKRNTVSSLRVGDNASIHGFSHPNLQGQDFLSYVPITKMDNMNDDIDSFRVGLKPSRNFACLWEHPGMEGTATCMHAGDRDSNIQGLKNTTSAISIHGNVGLIGYSHSNLTGSQITTYNDIVELDSFDDNIDSFQVISNNAPAVEMQHWMTDLFMGRESVKIRDIVLPGTHQSATYNLNTSSDLAPGETVFINAVKSDIADISKAASHTIYDQLVDGIRYLDLRVKAHQGRFVQVHGLIGTDMEEVFDDIARFHQQNPKEVILIEVDKVPDTKADRLLLAQLIYRKIGHALLPSPQKNPDFAADLLTLSDTWKNNKTLIVKMVGNDTGFDFWSPSSFEGSYANSQSNREVHDCIPTGCRGAPGISNRSADKFHYAAITLTPDAGSTAKSIIGLTGARGLIEFADWLKSAPAEWLPEYADKGYQPNIVATDFHTITSIVPAAVALNWPTVAAPSKKLEVTFSTDYQWIYNDDESSADRDISIWKVNPPAGYHALGSIAHASWSKPTAPVIVVKDSVAGALVKPVGFGRVWDDDGSDGRHDINIWKPIAPKGYSCLGYVATKGYWMAPSTDEIRCIHNSYLTDAESKKIWDDSGSGSKDDVAFWWNKAANNNGISSNTFYTTQNHNWAGFDYMNKVLDRRRITGSALLHIISAADNNYCIGIGSTAKRTTGITHCDKSGFAHRWNYEFTSKRLRSTHNNLCLDGNGHGNDITIAHCNNNGEQQWELGLFGDVQEAARDQCTDWFRSEGKLGAWNCHEGSNQRWLIQLFQ